MTTFEQSPLFPFAQQLVEKNGTDLLWTVGSPVMGRVNGQMVSLGGEALTSEQISDLVEISLSKRLLQRFDDEKEVDFSIDWPGVTRFRGNAFVQKGSPAIALRSIPVAIPTFDQLNLPESVRQFAKLPQGFVLITGPTGSGKSTTLASIVDYVNSNRACHILTIEDPIEYVHEHRQSVVNQREVGRDTDSFASALRSALREDPDVLLVGEMRDPESIATALTIAETGHLVFATLHTNDTSQALDRIVDVFPAERQQQIRVQLSTSLSGIVAQRLLPATGGGLAAAFEVLVATPAVRNLVKEGKSHQIRNVIMTSQEQGMQTLESSLASLVNSGRVSSADALARSMYPEEVRRAINMTA